MLLPLRPGNPGRPSCAGSPSRPGSPLVFPIGTACRERSPFCPIIQKSKIFNKYISIYI